MWRRDSNNGPPTTGGNAVPVSSRRSQTSTPTFDSFAGSAQRPPIGPRSRRSIDPNEYLRAAVANLGAASGRQSSKRYSDGSLLSAPQVRYEYGHFGPPTGSGYYDPSNGPRSPAISHHNKRPRTTMEDQSSYGSGDDRQPTQMRPAYIEGKYRRRDFRQGDILSLAWHRPNLDPNVDWSDPRLTNTIEGPAYSKRRLFVVMCLFKRAMVCLPLYTFNKTGLKEKDDYIKDEYVCMKNVGDENFVNQGFHPPVEASCHMRIDPDCAIDLAGCHVVSCKEDISILGKMPRNSYLDLKLLWLGVTQKALNNND